MPTNFPKRAYNIREFGVAYDIGPTKTYEQIAAGKLKARKVDGRTIILAEDAEEWARALPILTANEPQTA